MECNFVKSVGEDGFDGTVLNLNKQLRLKVCQDIANALNSGVISPHLRDGRLVPLSKIKGKEIVKLDEIRPIVVKSHQSKIM